MQNDIINEEAKIQRMRQFEQEAWDEMIEEKKAENRAKTMGITSVLEKQNKMPINSECNPIDDFYKAVEDQHAWLTTELNNQRLNES